MPDTESHCKRLGLIGLHEDQFMEVCGGGNSARLSRLFETSQILFQPLHPLEFRFVEAI